MEKETIRRACDNNPFKDEEIEQIKLVFQQEKLVQRGEEKVVTCPLCGKRRSISKSSYNGHFWSICESDACLKIIQ